MSAVSDPERSLVLSYAPADAVASLRALFALDEALGGILRTTSEPVVGQMRLAWWHEALTRLDTAAPPAEPILQGLALTALVRGVSGARLAKLVEGWEMLLEADDVTEVVMTDYAEARGGELFELAGILAGVTSSDPVRVAGRGWALGDLANHVSDAGAAGAARALAASLLREATSRRWSRNGRALGALAHIARMNLALPPGTAIPTGAPGRIARLILHRMTGR